MFQTRNNRDSHFDRDFFLTVAHGVSGTVSLGITVKKPVQSRHEAHEQTGELGICQLRPRNGFYHCGTRCFRRCIIGNNREKTGPLSFSSAELAHFIAWISGCPSANFRYTLSAGVHNMHVCACISRLALAANERGWFRLSGCALAAFFCRLLSIVGVLLVGRAHCLRMWSLYLEIHAYFYHNWPKGRLYNVDWNVAPLRSRCHASDKEAVVSGEHLPNTRQTSDMWP